MAYEWMGGDIEGVDKLARLYEYTGQTCPISDLKTPPPSVPYFPTTTSALNSPSTASSATNTPPTRCSSATTPARHAP
jgi:hypothetical protein